MLSLIESDWHAPSTTRVPPLPAQPKISWMTHSHFCKSLKVPQNLVHVKDYTEHEQSKQIYTLIPHFKRAALIGLTQIYLFL